MKILIKSAIILDKESSFHNQKKDILVENGKISKISENIETSSEKTIENVFVSQGWADSSVSFGEPGFEDAETLENGMKTAAHSGFTQVMVTPNLRPVTDTKSAVSFLKNATQNTVNQLFPIGALTTQSKGETLAELYDMKQGGAVAFGDYKKTILNPNLLKIALQYTQPFDGIVISFANDPFIAGKGVVNEHINATRLGLKGIPTLAEELIIARDLEILKYTGGKLHIPTISSKKSVEMIRKAKAEGLNVSTSVAIHHLHLSDDNLLDFNTNYKILPPLRNQEHIEALREGISDGIIDMVTSDHCPVNFEYKNIEFDLANFGTIGLETAFGTLIQHVSAEKAVELLTAAKHRFQLPKHSISEGETANLTLFTPDGEHIFTTENILSSSKNSAFIGEKIKGKIFGIIVDNQSIFN